LLKMSYLIPAEGLVNRHPEEVTSWGPYRLKIDIPVSIKKPMSLVISVRSFPKEPLLPSNIDWLFKKQWR